MNKCAAALAALLAASPAFGAWKDIPPTDFAVAPPPAPDSPENRKDFTDLLLLQAERSEADCALARTMKIPDFHSLYDSSGLLSPAELAAVGAFVDRASLYASTVSGYYKKLYARPRPYNEDARVEPCADKPSGATAYPSTHATSGALDACLLSELFPQRANTFALYGKRVGDLRAIVGVHHPTDVAAGQDLAARICARLLGEEDFHAELSRVKSALPAR